MKWLSAKLAVFVLVVGSLSGWLGYNLLQQVPFARAEQEVHATRQQLAQVEDLSSVFRQVGKAVEPSVVSINVHKKVKGAARTPFDEDMLRRFFPDRDGDGEPDVPDGFRFHAPGDGTFEQIGTGSGVIIEAANGSGYILTNNHVAGDAEELTVTLSDGREITKTKVLGTDAKTDLAVVKIEADRLIPAKWGNSEELNKGDWILAFGSPFGYVGSMTHGIVSATNRTNVGILQPGGYEDFIQVDAPINPGNSGGPIANIHGEVVGISTAIASHTGGFQGIGFAIPSNMAKFVYTALKDKGKVTRGWVGVSIGDVSNEPDVARSFGYKGATGVLVREALPETPAFGKLQEGDIITQLNGQPVRNTIELRNAIAATLPGNDIALGVYRDGKDQEIKIKVSEQPENMLASARSGRGGSMRGRGRAEEETGPATLGMTLSDLTENRAERLGLSGVQGALVTAVEPRSPAARAHIMPGDVITRIGPKNISNAAEASDALAKANLADGARLYLVGRDGSRRFAFIRQ